MLTYRVISATVKFLLVCGLGFLGYLMVLTVEKEQKVEKERLEAGGILLNNAPADWHILVDKSQGKQWRYVSIQGVPVIIPGSERPWPDVAVEKKP